MATNRTQYPSDVVVLVVLWRLRYQLSLRDLPEMFALRGIVLSHQTVHDWEAKLTPALAEGLRRRRKGKAGRSWYVDETYLKVDGRWCYLYRAIDRTGALVDVLFSEHRDMKAARAFFRSAKAMTGLTPDRVTTDGHDSYPRARACKVLGWSCRAANCAVGSPPSSRCETHPITPAPHNFGSSALCVEAAHPI